LADGWRDRVATLPDFRYFPAEFAGLWPQLARTRLINVVNTQEREGAPRERDMVFGKWVASS
jgi:hypothetical protein